MRAYKAPALFLSEYVCFPNSIMQQPLEICALFAAFEAPELIPAQLSLSLKIDVGNGVTTNVYSLSLYLLISAFLVSSLVLVFTVLVCICHHDSFLKSCAVLPQTRVQPPDAEHNIKFCRTGAVRLRSASTARWVKPE